MRNLQFKDVFTVSRILKKMQLKFDVKGLTQEELGAKLIYQFVENIGEAEEEVTNFLADLKGIDKARLQSSPIDEIFSLIEEFKKLPGLSAFFTQVGKSMKS
jgi:hypothetical protein